MKCVLALMATAPRGMQIDIQKALWMVDSLVITLTGQAEYNTFRVSIRITRHAGRMCKSVPILQNVHKE